MSDAYDRCQSKWVNGSVAVDCLRWVSPTQVACLVRLCPLVDDLKLLALSTNPTLTQAYLNLGTIYASMGKIQSAIDAWKTLERIQPDNAALKEARNSSQF